MSSTALMTTRIPDAIMGQILKFLSPTVKSRVIDKLRADTMHWKNEWKKDLFEWFDKVVVELRDDSVLLHFADDNDGDRVKFGLWANVSVHLLTEGNTLGISSAPSVDASRLNLEMSSNIDQNSYSTFAGATVDDLDEFHAQKLPQIPFNLWRSALWSIALGITGHPPIYLIRKSTTIPLRYLALQGRVVHTGKRQEQLYLLPQHFPVDLFRRNLLPQSTVIEPASTVVSSVMVQNDNQSDDSKKEETSAWYLTKETWGDISVRDGKMEWKDYGALGAIDYFAKFQLDQMITIICNSDPVKMVAAKSLVDKTIEPCRIYGRGLTSDNLDSMFRLLTKKTPSNSLGYEVFYYSFPTDAVSGAIYNCNQVSTIYGSKEFASALTEFYVEYTEVLTVDEILALTGWTILCRNELVNIFRGHAYVSGSSVERCPTVTDHFSDPLSLKGVLANLMTYSALTNYHNDAKEIERCAISEPNSFNAPTVLCSIVSQYLSLDIPPNANEWFNHPTSFSYIAPVSRRPAA